MNLTQAALLAAASVAAGAINAVAGGGTLVSFPAAITAGLSPLAANATNAVALTPGQIAAAFGYRRELGRDRAVVRLLLPAAVVGGAIGSLLLLFTPQRFFNAIVPLLVLFATALLVVQNLKKQPPAREGEAADGWALPENPIVAVGLQLLVGVYGGYFGAGMGIMMLALYARLGGRDIHRMNGVKAVIGASINAIAAAAFVIARVVDYRAGAVMAVGAIGGGFVGAALARKVKPATVRWGVVAIGVVLSVQLAYKQWG